MSRTNADYWTSKVAANRERDLRDTRALDAHGWTVLRFWEHEDMAAAAMTVRDAVLRARDRSADLRDA